MKTSSLRRVIVALTIAVSAATVHGAWFASTDANEAAPVITISTWDYFEKSWTSATHDLALESALTVRHSEDTIVAISGATVTLPVGLNAAVLDAQALASLEIPEVPGATQYLHLLVSKPDNYTSISEWPATLDADNPWSGPLDYTDDDLGALDIEGSVGVHTVTADGGQFTWDIGRWSKGDIFAGLNDHTYKVLDRNGNFKRFVASADRDQPAEGEVYNNTTGCATNWKTGEVFATNFGDYRPAVNIIGRHPQVDYVGDLSPYSSPLRRIETTVHRTDDESGKYKFPYSWPDAPRYPIDVNPESVVFDGDMNMFVGHSFGNFRQAPATWENQPGKEYDFTDYWAEYAQAVDGLPAESVHFDTEGWSLVVDETGVRMLLAPAGTTAPANFTEKRATLEVSPRLSYNGDDTLAMATARDFYPAVTGLPDWDPDGQLPQSYLSDPSTGTALHRLSGGSVVASLIPSRWSLGKRLHKYQVQTTGKPYVGSEDGEAGARRSAYWTFTGRQGTDWIDLDVTGGVMYYTSEDAFIHRYRVKPGPNGEPVGQMPDVGVELAVDGERTFGKLAVAVGFSGGAADGLRLGDYRFHGLRILPPGDGTGGFLVAVEGGNGVHRFKQDGTWVQRYWAPRDANGNPADGDEDLVGRFYAVEVDPGGRTFWASSLDTGKVYQFDIASGRLLRTIDVVEYRQPSGGDPGRVVQGICIMWEYTAPQEICFVNGVPEGIDNDGDGYIDENCKAIEICSAVSTGDDDNDGLNDQYDPDCSAEKPPVAIDDAYAINQGASDPNPTVLTVPAADGVLRRGPLADYDRDSGEYADVNALSVARFGTNESSLTALPTASITTANGGTVVLQANGAFVYTPAPTFHGVDSFAYQVTDGYPVAPDDREVPNDGLDDIATVTITVAPKVADDGPFNVWVGESLSMGGLLANDPANGVAPSAGPVTISEAGPSTGPVAFSGSRSFTTANANNVTVNADGSFAFAATNLAYGGLDYFTYAVHDTVSRSWNIATVAINVRRPVITVVVPDQAKSYDGTPLPTTCAVTSERVADPAYSMTYTGTIRGGGGTYGPTETAPTNAGDYTATCVHTDPVLGPQTATGTIVISPIPLSVTAHDKTKVVDDPLPTLDGVWTGFILNQAVANEYTTTAVQSSPVGTYPITPEPDLNDPVLRNYVLTINPGILTVTPKSIDVVAQPVCIADTPYVNFTISAANFTPAPGEDIVLRWKDSSGAVVATQTFIWTNTSAPFTQQVLWPGAVVDGNGVVTDWPGWIFNGSEWVQGNDGFQLTRPTSTVEIEVNPTMSLQVSYPPPTPNCNAAPPRKATIVATGGVFDYDGQSHAATCRVTGAAGESLPGVLTYDGFGSTAPINVGTYPATCTFAGNADYSPLSATTTVVINPIPLVVRANDKTIYVGDPLPTLDGVWTGFVSGETATAVYSTTAANSNTAGSFPITPTPASSPVLGNYLLTVAPGTLTILPRATTCSATGYVTYSQGGWGSNPNGGNPGALLAANFATVYGSGGARIGGAYKLTFTSAAAIANYLPAGGQPRVLTSSQTNPTSSQGVLSAQLLALQLAVDFSRAGVLQSGLGAMVMQSGPLAGQSVDSILAMANTVFGGTTSALPSGMSLSGLSSLLESIIMNYHEGADGGLFGCPSSPPVCTAVPPTLGRALVRRDSTFDGRIEGSIQLMQAIDVAMNSTAVITGQLLLPGVPQKTFNGGSSVTVENGSGAATPTSHRFMFNSGATLGSLVQRTAAVDLPVVATPPASVGTRSVTLNTAGAIGDPTTLRDLTLNSNVGPIAVPAGTYRTFIANYNSAFVLGVAGATEPSIYNFQTLTLNSGSRLEIVGPVIITVKNSISANGPINPSQKTERLTLRVSNGDFTLSSGVPFYGYVEVPNGRVTVNNGAKLVGGLVADKLTNNSGGLVQLVGLPGRTCDQDPGPVALVVTIDDKVKTYGDPDPTLTYRITSGGPVDSGVLSGAISRLSGEVVGEYVIGAGTLAATSDYTLTVIAGKLTVLPRPAVVTAGTGTKVYGSPDPALTAVTTTGFLPADLPSITRTQTRASGENVGSYTTAPIVSGTVLSNYSVSLVSGDFTITPKPLTAVANNKTKTQGTANPVLDGALTGVVGGDGITASYSTTATTSSPAGSYPITVTLADPGNKLGNYSVTKTSGTLTVTPATPPCSVRTFAFTGNSSTSGSAGNVLTYTVSGASVRASAHSRLKSGNSWSNAYLGVWSEGLGVTDGSEGSGSNNTHKVDNGGDRYNYVLLRFSESMVFTKAYLDSIGSDSDAQIWVGTVANAYTNGVSMNDSRLSGLQRFDSSGSSSERWATFNGGNLSGNVIIIAASTASSTNDAFKVSKVQSSCSGS